MPTAQLRDACDVAVGRGTAVSTIAQYVGQRVRQLRTERGWTQQELTERIDLAINISSIERGMVSIRLDTLQRLADDQGVAPQDLLP